MTMPTDYYGTDITSWRLTVLHRVIKEMTARQNRVAWLPHRAARLRVLKAERRRRMTVIAASWKTGADVGTLAAILAAVDECERETIARRRKLERDR